MKKCKHGWNRKVCYFAELAIFIWLSDQSQSGLVEKRQWNKAGAYSEVDVEKVDMFRFPEFQSLPWWKSSLKPGDCIYIPKEYIVYFEYST